MKRTLRSLVSLSMVAVLTGMLSSHAWADAYSDAILADNPTAYYRMNDVRGNGGAPPAAPGGPIMEGTVGAAIDQVGGNNGTYIGGTTPVKGPIKGSRKDGGALFAPVTGNFYYGTPPGSVAQNMQSVLVIPDAPALDLAGQATVEIWMNWRGESEPAIKPPRHTFLSKAQSRINTAALGDADDASDVGFQNYNFHIINRAGDREFRYSGGKNFGGHSTSFEERFGMVDATPHGGPILGDDIDSLPAANEWVHVVFTIDTAPADDLFDPGEAKLYIDGKFVGHANTQGGRLGLTNNDPLYVGGDDFLTQAATTGFNKFGGALAELAIYDHILNQSQIEDHYLIATQGFVPEPSVIGLSAIGLMGLLARRRRSH